MYLPPQTPQNSSKLLKFRKSQYTLNINFTEMNTNEYFLTNYQQIFKKNYIAVQAHLIDDDFLHVFCSVLFLCPRLYETISLSVLFSYQQWARFKPPCLLTIAVMPNVILLSVPAPLVKVVMDIYIYIYVSVTASLRSCEVIRHCFIYSFIIV